MRHQFREHLPRLALALLLAAGLVMPLLFALDLAKFLSSCLLLAFLLCLILEGLSLSRRSALWGGLALGVFFLVWLSSPGLSVLQDILLGLSLHLSGVSGALPLVGNETALFLASVLSLLSFFCSRRSAGCLGAVLLTVGALLMLWLADRPELILPLLPAGAAALCLFLLDRHEEASPVRVLPWAATLVLLAFLLTPRTGLVVPSLKEKADEIRQNILDRLFFTEPRDVFSLSSEGYYPQGVSQLGGPASPSDHPVMQVSTPRAAYLRGVTMNAYDGRSWRNTLGGRRYLWEASSMAASRIRLFDQHLPPEGLATSLTEPMTVSVRMLSAGASTLFVPQRIREFRAGGDLVAYFSLSSELFNTRNLQAGDTWSVTAPLFQSGDPGLAVLVDAAAAREEDPRAEEIRETFLSLPAHLEEPVWQLAADITADCDSPYEKAFALQTWLSRSCRYTLDAAVQPADLDFVTNFLFNTREGYCTYFASAMTVLCRMAGLPARYVEGYLAIPDEQGEALVTGLDAHAWTEVYFQGFGWLTFDATPRQPGNSPNSSTGSSAPDASPDPTETPSPAEESALPESSVLTPSPTASPATPSPAPNEDSPDAASPDDSSPDPLPDGASASGFPWLLLLPLALAAMLLLRWRLTDPGYREKRLSTEDERFDCWLSDVLARLSAMGHTRQSGETPMSFTRRMDSERLLPVSLSTLGECVSLLHYGRVQARPADTALARAVALDLKKPMPPAARLKYAWRRMLPQRPRL